MVSGSNDIAEERRKLAVEIFDLTGQKVGVDDPLTTAALFYSAKMRQAADAMDKATETAYKTFEAAVTEAIERAHRGLAAAVVEAAKQEGSKTKSELASFARDLKKGLRRGLEATITPAAADGKLLVRMIATIAVVAAAGVYVGAACFPIQKRLTLQEREQLTIGKTFIEIAPSLDSKTRQQIMSVLDQRSRSR